VTDRGNDLALVEAALFLSPQPLTRRGLAKILGGVQLAYVDQLLEDLATAYENSSRGIELHVEEGRALLRVKRQYIDRVAHLAPQQDIPRPVLRTLAVIAYNHPMTQADLIRVRGNKGYGHVQELMERGLITGEEHGRTLLLQVTKEFLRHFGLSTVEEFRFHASSEGIEMPEDDATASAEGTGVSGDDAAASAESADAVGTADAPSTGEGHSAEAEVSEPEEPTPTEPSEPSAEKDEDPSDESEEGVQSDDRGGM